MKKALVLTTGLVSLMAMSFTLPKQSKFEVVNTQDDSYITNVNLISLEDLQTLEAATVKGASQTIVIHNAYRNEVTAFVVKSHKNVLEQNSTLNSIFSKYE